MAVVLNRLGVAIGHERWLDAGICSWMHAVDDENPPFRAPPSRESDFSATLAYVRDPETAIGSIVLENDGGQSFCYRRFHVLRRLGVDIARHREPIARAVDSYLAWMRIVALRRPLATLRVESLVEDLWTNEDALAGAWVAIDFRNRAAAEATPKTVNSSQGLRGFTKPVLPDGWRRGLPKELGDDLQTFCLHYRYGA
jgi:hypothetical protein